MTWAGVHRWLAIVLVALLVVWSVTGLLFHLKPGWDRAYDQLSADRGHTTETLDTVLGPLTRVDGKLATPLTDEQAKALAADAIARSPHAAEYGSLVRASSDTATVHLVYAGASVAVRRDSGRISQHGSDTDRIDWLYRIHYLQWTGNASIDKVLALAGLGLIWAVMLPGIVLFVRRLRR